MNLYVKDPRWPRWNAQSGMMVQLLGLPKGAKLPQAGLPVREIQGILVWVDPLVPEYKGRYKKHRVRASCPACGKIMSAGRLHQHASVHNVDWRAKS